MPPEKKEIARVQISALRRTRLSPSQVLNLIRNIQTELSEYHIKEIELIL